MSHKQKIEVTKLYESSVCTRWLVKFPSTPTKEGRRWYATTYPNSDQVFVETVVTRRASRNLRVADAVRIHIAKSKSSVTDGKH
jgi:hypothetical protein